MLASSAGAAASVSTRAFIAAPPRRPGLVLGLDRGGVCEGYRFSRFAPPMRRDAALSAGARAGGERLSRGAGAGDAPVRRAPRGDGPAFLVERAHPSYAGRLALAEQAHFIRGAVGRSGNNIDYLGARWRISLSSAFASESWSGY